ncbi:MAG: A24 family peptidase [Acidobacteriaceae bacterium]
MTSHSQTIYLAAALICAATASVHDLRSRRIPNLLTGPAILFGLLLHLILGGPAQMGLSALAGVVAGGIFFLFFMAGGMGAGDVKLMAAVGCLAGTEYIQDILIATVILGACMGLGLAVYRGRFRQTFMNVMTLVQHHSAAGLAEHPDINVRNASTLRLPYALPIALGCLLTLFLASGKELVR